MKHLVTSLLVLSLSAAAATAGNFFGAGPWANDWYYPGQMDGKYQGSVTGVNIAGAIAFAFRDGVPTVSTNSTSSASGSTNTVQNTVIVDPFQNYFVVFVQGMTYSGTTTASINVDQETITGALYSGQNAYNFIRIQNPNGLEQIILDNLPLLNRGVNGGFQANINSKKAVFTFSGTGELSAPAFPQTIQGLDTNGNTVGSSQFISNAVTAVLQTATVPFDVQGIKVSSSSASTVTQPTGTGN